MTPRSPEQSVHDKVNLNLLVKRLVKTVTDEFWNDATGHDTWIKAQGTLQKVGYAKKLLKNVELYDVDPSPNAIQRYRDTETALFRVESFILEVEKRSTPTIARPDPLLPRIPILSTTKARNNGENESTSPPENVPLTSSEHTPPPHPVDGLLIPSDQSLASANLLHSPNIPILPIAPIPSTKPATATADPTAPSVLHNSNALQQELSEQLAQMATQLKRNAMHFSESLVKDRAVVDDAQLKIEGNFDMMAKERVRLRDRRAKSGSTTCLVLLSILVVAIAFVLTFFVIRLT